MSRDETHALIIWSTFARDTVREIAQHAGMTETEGRGGGPASIRPSLPDAL